MATLLHLVVMDQVWKDTLRPAPRNRIDFVRERTHGHGNRDAFGIKVPELAPRLPIETSARHRRVRQPCDRDVVEDVVAREALGLSLKDA